MEYSFMHKIVIPNTKAYIEHLNILFIFLKGSSYSEPNINVHKPKPNSTIIDKIKTTSPKSCRLPKTPNQYNSLIILNFN